MMYTYIYTTTVIHPEDDHVVILHEGPGKVALTLLGSAYINYTYMKTPFHKSAVKV
jgi:hypothetical protein